MKINLKLLKELMKIQLLSIIFSLVSRININILTVHPHFLTNSVVLFLSLIFFVMFCILLNIMFLDKNIINIFFMSISYLIYWRIFLNVTFIHTNNPNDYSIGILGLSLEMFLGIFHYIIVIISSIISISIKNSKGIIRNKN